MLAQLVLRDNAAQKILVFVLVVGLCTLVYLAWLAHTEWERSCCGKTAKFCSCARRAGSLMSPPDDDAE